MDNITSTIQHMLVSCSNQASTFLSAARFDMISWCRLGHVEPPAGHFCGQARRKAFRIRRMEDWNYFRVFALER
jgi:hypothetical protein